MGRTNAQGTDEEPLKTTSVTDPGVNAAVSTAIVDVFSGVIITTTTTGNAQTLQTPTNATAIKRFSVINNDTSSDTITVNGIVIGVGEVAYFVWDGTAWAADLGLTASEKSLIDELDSVANNSMIHKDNSGDYKEITIGAAGTVPMSNGATSDPTFQEIGGGNTADVELGENITAGDLVRIINDGGAKAKLITEELTEALGSEYNFGSSFQYGNATQIDEDKVFIIYGGTNAYGFVATVSGTTISYGTPVQFATGSLFDYMGLDSIDTDKVLISYKDPQVSSHGTAIVGTISGDVVTFGTKALFEATALSESDVSKLDTNKALISYDTASAKAIVATVSGTVITFGNAVEFDAGGSAFIRTAQIDEDKVFISYEDTNNSNYGTGIIANVIGDVVDFGTPVVFESSTFNNIENAICEIDTDKACIVFEDSGNSNRPTAIICTVSGTTITAGTKQEIHTETETYLAVAKIDTDSVAIMTGEDHITATISGTVLTFGSKTAHATFVSGINQSCSLGNGKVFMLYLSSTYKAKILQGDFIKVYQDQVAGILQETGTSGQTKSVMTLGGISTVHSGLTPGVKQYTQSDGSIGTTVTANPIGRAISATDINTEGS